MTDNKQQLMDCPFCGIKPSDVKLDRKKYNYIGCGNKTCHIRPQGAYYDDPEDAIYAWQAARAKPPSDIKTHGAAKLLERLKNISSKNPNLTIYTDSIEYIEQMEVFLDTYTDALLKERGLSERYQRELREEINQLKAVPAPLPDNKEVKELKSETKILDLMIISLRESINTWCDIHNKHCGVDARMDSVEEVFKNVNRMVNALIISQPPAISDDAVERVAKAITAYRYDAYEKPAGNTQCKSEYVGYLWTRWENEAKAAIAAMEGK